MAVKSYSYKLAITLLPGERDSSVVEHWALDYEHMGSSPGQGKLPWWLWVSHILTRNEKKLGYEVEYWFWPPVGPHPKL